MNRRCPICALKKKGFIYRQKFNNKSIAVMAGYDVVICQNCGMLFADRIPVQADFDKYYASMSKYEFNYKDGVVAVEYVDHFGKIVDFIEPYLGNKKIKILDIGCATGALLSVFKLRRYLDLWGIDPSPSCVKAVRKLYGIKASIDSIASLKTNKKFDLIILSAVLEHLVDFDSSMRKIRSLLNKGGLLFVGVPDAERFDKFISAPFQQFSVEHINYFSRLSLQNLLGSFGFEVVKTKKGKSGLNQTVDPDLFMLVKLTEKAGFKIVKDRVGGVGLRKYIKKCQTIDLKLKQLIRQKLKGVDKVIVWGVGTHTQRLIGKGWLDVSKVLFFVDSNKRYVGKKLNGIKIKSPEEIKETNPILISTYSYQKEIENQIRLVLNLENEVIKIYS